MKQKKPDVGYISHEKRSGKTNSQIRKELTKKYSNSFAEELFKSYYRSKIIIMASAVVMIGAFTLLFLGRPDMTGAVVLEGGGGFPFGLIAIMFAAAFIVGVLVARMFKR